MKNPRMIVSTLLILALSVVLTGCGGGVVGTTGYQRQLSPADTSLKRGWEEFSLGHYANAIAEFNNTLTYTHSPSQALEANVGLGWAHTRSTGIADGAAHFEKAVKDDNDAKVGMAGYYLSTAKKENMKKGIDLLASFGLDSVDYVYTPKRDYGMNNAKAHALMAALYNYNGEVEKARAHAKKAKELNVPPKEPPYNSVTQIVQWVESRQ